MRPRQRRDIGIGPMRRVALCNQPEVLDSRFEKCIYNIFYPSFLIFTINKNTAITHTIRLCFFTCQSAHKRPRNKHPHIYIPLCRRLNNLPSSYLRDCHAFCRNRLALLLSTSKSGNRVGRGRWEINIFPASAGSYYCYISMSGRCII